MAGAALVACGDHETVTPGPDASTDAAVDSPPDAPGALGDILDELRAVPGMKSVTEKTTMVEGYRLFVLEYTQPADHAAPGGDVPALADVARICGKRRPRPRQDLNRAQALDLFSLKLCCAPDDFARRVGCI